jgi:hypothetical protein
MGIASFACTRVCASVMNFSEEKLSPSMIFWVSGPCPLSVRSKTGEPSGEVTSLAAEDNRHGCALLCVVHACGTTVLDGSAGVRKV